MFGLFKKTEIDFSQPLCQALVVGCARSGTSVLGELIEAHPRVKYLFEAHRIWQSAGHGENGSHRLTEKQAAPKIINGIRRHFADMHQENKDAFVVEKNPRNALRIPFLRAIFPEAKLIHIIRDGRDVACSMLPGLTGDKWGHLKPHDWQAIEKNYDGIGRCAMTWQSVMETVLSDLQNVSHHEIRYENLVTDPIAEANKLFDFLQLDMAPSVTEFAGKIQDKTAGSYHAAVQSQWYRDDHQRRMGRWRENLSADDQELLDKLIGPLLTRLGYPRLNAVHLGD